MTRSFDVQPRAQDLLWTKVFHDLDEIFSKLHKYGKNFRENM
jgi:hypothetical protein